MGRRYIEIGIRIGIAIDIRLTKRDPHCDGDISPE